MKKLMIMMVVMGTMAFGRDFEHRERLEVEELMNMTKISQEMSPREDRPYTQDMERYEDYHWELMTMDRGHQDR